MTRMRNVRKSFFGFYTFVLTTIFVIISFLVAWQDSATYDEKAHIPAGYASVAFQDMRLNPEHPPLIKNLSAIPLLFLNLNFPFDNPKWNGINEQWEIGQDFLYNYENNFQKILFWARVPVILFTAFLVLLLAFWVRNLYGTIAGSATATLLLLDPTILAHSHYVTTDTGASLLITLAIIAFVTFLKEPIWKNAVIAGLLIGLAQLAKFSALTLIPLFALLLPLYIVVLLTQKRSPHTQQILKQYLRYGIIVVGIIFVSIWGVYAFNTYHTPSWQIHAIAHAQLTSEIVPENLKTLLHFTLRYPVLEPLAQYISGISMVMSRVEYGNTYFFMEEVSNIANPLYFPIIFALKETLPFLILLFLSIISCFYLMTMRIATTLSKCETVSRNTTSVASFVSNYFLEIALILFVILYSWVSITGNLNIGFRHIFPIIPPLVVLISIAVASLFKKFANSQRTKVYYSSFLLGFFMWIFFIAIESYPHYLSYYNPIAGGTDNGYKHALDSNYDWGQDLGRLQKWVENYNNCVNMIHSFPKHTCNTLTDSAWYPNQSSIEKLHINYFGGGDPLAYFDRNSLVFIDENSPPSVGWYAISATLYQESLHKAHTEEFIGYQWISRNYTPVARAGKSIFIFYIDKI